MKKNNLKKLALKAADDKNSFVNLVVMWEYASNQPQNEQALRVYLEIRETFERGLGDDLDFESNQSFLDEKNIFVHWASLKEMFNNGYYGTVTTSNEIVIRYD